MELKKYQLRLLDEVKTCLAELAKQQAASNKHAALDAWDTVRVPGRRYAERRKLHALSAPAAMAQDAATFTRGQNNESCRASAQSCPENRPPTES